MKLEVIIQAHESPEKLFAYWDANIIYVQLVQPDFKALHIIIYLYKTRLVC